MVTNKDNIKKALFGDNIILSIGKKILEYGAIFLFIWKLGLPMLQLEVQAEIAVHEKEVKDKEDAKIPFRELLGQEMGVQSDRVHIVMGDIKHNVDAAIDSVKKFSEEWIPYLEKERNTIRPRLEIINGDSFWIATDNKPYRVETNGFYYKDGKWKLIFTF